MPVWQQSFDLLVKVYKITTTFPAEERFGLVSDMRRASNSITHNIAEGFGRFEKRDNTRFYKISRGSAFELTSQLLVSDKLSYVKEKTKASLVESTRKIIEEINALIHSLESE